MWKINHQILCRIGGFKSCLGCGQLNSGVYGYIFPNSSLRIMVFAPQHIKETSVIKSVHLDYRGLDLIGLYICFSIDLSSRPISSRIANIWVEDDIDQQVTKFRKKKIRFQQTHLLFTLVCHWLIYFIFWSNLSRYLQVAMYVHTMSVEKHWKLFPRWIRFNAVLNVKSSGAFNP